MKLCESNRTGARLPQMRVIVIPCGGCCVFVQGTVEPSHPDRASLIVTGSKDYAGWSLKT
jgi:hypothetical protein